MDRPHEGAPRVSAIVLAAGASARFGASKQFIELFPGVRLIDKALDAVFEITDRVTLVLPPGHEWHGPRVDATVPGGSSRVASVNAGLSALAGDPEIIVVHDAAHPLASRSTFLDLIEAILAGADAAVPVLSLGDVVKRQDRQGRITTVGRDGLGLAQVPMAFSTTALLSAHAAPTTTDTPYWEDSMLIERDGGIVVAVPGSSRNIHVVTPEDLSVARALAARHKATGRFIS